MSCQIHGQGSDQNYEVICQSGCSTYMRGVYEGAGGGYCICEIPRNNNNYSEMCFCSLVAVGKSEDSAATLENRGRRAGLEEPLVEYI